MKNYINFINAKDVSKNNLTLSLGCSINEIKILQYMSRSLLEKETNILVANIIENVFNISGIGITKYLKYIKSLLDLEYLVLSGDNTQEFTLLGLINSYVSLNSNFLKILENDKNDYFSLPSITPYNDNFDYLNDEFLKINLLEKLAFLRKANKINSKKYITIKNNLDSIHIFIKNRLKITKKKPNILSFLRPYNLSQNEQIIFFTILKEEYYDNNEKMRESNSLIELVSSDEHSKMKNKHIFDERSKLIKEGLIDYYDDMFKAINVNNVCKSFYIPENILHKIMHPDYTRENKTYNIEKQDIFEFIKPKEQLKNIVLPKSTKERLNLLIEQLNIKVSSILKKWGINDNKSNIDAKIIFYGKSGTGKTITAYALANALKKPILSLDCSKILSMYIGESEKNVRKIFDTYKTITSSMKKKPILLLNEADQFLSQRSTINNSGADKMYNQMQNIFLEQIENFDSILIATTNLLENIDPAFSRRFNYKIEFERPNKEQRIEIWKILLPKNAAYSEKFDVHLLSNFDLSGGQIKIIIKNTAYKVAVRSNPIFNNEDFIDEIKKELETNFDSYNQSGFL